MHMTNFRRQFDFLEHNPIGTQILNELRLCPLLLLKPLFTEHVHEAGPFQFIILHPGFFESIVKLLAGAFGQRSRLHGFEGVGNVAELILFDRLGGLERWS